MTEVIQQAFNAASSASVYLLLAVGLTIVFGLSRILNIAYGDFATLGAYIIFIVAPGGAIAFVWGFGVAAIVMAVLFVIFERLLFRRTLSRPVNGFLIALGLVQIIEYGLQWKYTDNPVIIKPASPTLWVIGGVDISVDRVIVIAGTIATSSLRSSRSSTRPEPGLAVIRAIAHDREVAALDGCPGDQARFDRLRVIGGLLAGAGGAFTALLQAPTPQLGAELVLKKASSSPSSTWPRQCVRGAVAGAVMLATTEAVLIGVNLTSWLDALEFGAVIVLLLWRPLGLLGGVAHSM